MDWVKTLGGTRTHIFSTSKAKKALEKNFSMISTKVIPILTEFSLISGILLSFYGVEYFIIFGSTICKLSVPRVKSKTQGAYVWFTKKTALMRKKFITSQHQYDKIGDFMVGFIYTI